MPQIWPVNKGGEGYRRLFSFQADSVMMLASCQNCFLYKTDILILTGISTASELAKENGSMIHLLHGFWRVGNKQTRCVFGHHTASFTPQG